LIKFQSQHEIVNHPFCITTTLSGNCACVLWPLSTHPWVGGFEETSADKDKMGSL